MRYAVELTRDQWHTVFAALLVQSTDPALEATHARDSAVLTEIASQLPREVKEDLER